MTYSWCGSFLEILQLLLCDNVMIHQNVGFLVLGLNLGRTESKPGGKPGPRVLVTREHVRQVGPVIQSQVSI